MKTSNQDHRQHREEQMFSGRIEFLHTYDYSFKRQIRGPLYDKIYENEKAQEAWFTSMAIVSSSLMSCRAPTSAHVTSGTVAKPSLLAEGWTLAREAWKSDMRMDRPASSSSDSFLVVFSSCKRCHSSFCWTQGRRT